jgi:hypothetical protein
MEFERDIKKFIQLGKGLLVLANPKFGMVLGLVAESPELLVPHNGGTRTELSLRITLCSDVNLGCELELEPACTLGKPGEENKTNCMFQNCPKFCFFAFVFIGTWDCHHRVVCKVLRLRGEKGQFWHNKASHT